jgi:hypothetical protein
MCIFGALSEVRKEITSFELSCCPDKKAGRMHSQQLSRTILLL